MKNLIATLCLLLAAYHGHAQTNYACTITGCGGSFVYGVAPFITVRSNYIVTGSVIADGTYCWNGSGWVIPGSLYNPSLSQIGGHWSLTGSFGNPLCTGSVGIYSGAPDLPQTWSGAEWTSSGGVLPWTVIRSVGVDVVTFTSTNAAGEWQPVGTNHFEVPVSQPSQFFRSVLTISPPQ